VPPTSAPPARPASTCACWRGGLAVATILHGVGTIFGRTLGGLVNALDPEAVILGGGVMQVGAPLWAPLEAALRGEVLTSAADVPLRPAALGVDAGVIGAAALASELAEAPYATVGR